MKAKLRNQLKTKLKSLLKTKLRNQLKIRLRNNCNLKFPPVVSLSFRFLKQIWNATLTPLAIKIHLQFLSSVNRNTKLRLSMMEARSLCGMNRLLSMLKRKIWPMLLKCKCSTLTTSRVS